MIEDKVLDTARHYFRRQLNGTMYSQDMVGAYSGVNDRSLSKELAGILVGEGILREEGDTICSDCGSEIVIDNKFYRNGCLCPICGYGEFKQFYSYERYTVVDGKSREEMSLLRDMRTAFDVENAIDAVKSIHLVVYPAYKRAVELTTKLQSVVETLKEVLCYAEDVVNERDCVR